MYNKIKVDFDLTLTLPISTIQKRICMMFGIDFTKTYHVEIFGDIQSVVVDGHNVLETRPLMDDQYIETPDLLDCDNASDIISNNSEGCNENN